MATIFSFALGYVLGAKAGEEGLADLREAWRAISTSPEARQLVASAASISRGLLHQGRDMMADRLRTQAGLLIAVA